RTGPSTWPSPPRCAWSWNSRTANGRSRRSSRAPQGTRAPGATRTSTPRGHRGGPSRGPSARRPWRSPLHRPLRTCPRPEPAPALGGRDGVHPAVVRLDGQGVLLAVVDLLGVHEGDHGHPGARELEGPVVPAGAVAEAVAARVDGESGREHDVHLGYG